MPSHEVPGCLAELAPEVIIPFADHTGISAAHLLPVLLPAGGDKSIFMANMKMQGIQTSFHYPPNSYFYGLQTDRRTGFPPDNGSSRRAGSYPAVISHPLR